MEVPGFRCRGAGAVVLRMCIGADVLTMLIMFIMFLMLIMLILLIMLIMLIILIHHA